MESCGNCLSAETECSLGALRFGAGEKKLVTAGCLRLPWVHSNTRVHVYSSRRPTRTRTYEATLNLADRKGGARAPCAPPWIRHCPGWYITRYGISQGYLVYRDCTGCFPILPYLRKFTFSFNLIQHLLTSSRSP